MSAPVVTVRSGAPAKEAARLLVEHGFTAIPVVDDDDRLLGFVTEADLLHDRFLPDPRTLIHDGPPQPAAVPAATVDEVMATAVVGAGPDTHLNALSRLMLERHLRSLPIVDGGRLVGIVTRRDLLRTIARDDAEIARDVRHRLDQVGRRRWQVTVADGVVVLTDDGADTQDRHIASVIAGARPGVVEVRFTTQR